MPQFRLFVYFLSPALIFLAVVTNSGSSNKWQSARGVRLMGSGKWTFDVIVEANPKTPNSCTHLEILMQSTNQLFTALFVFSGRIIVGCVPESFTCSGSKQWVGAVGSYGYIGGTGGICFSDPRSVEYGGHLFTSFTN